MKFLQELKSDTGDKIISLTPFELANGYTLYAFKISDGPIGSSTYGPRSKSTMGSARLEVSFAATVNENIKVILNYQMLGELEFDQFKAVIVLSVVVVNFTLKRLIVWFEGLWYGSTGWGSVRTTSCLTVPPKYFPGSSS